MLLGCFIPHAASCHVCVRAFQNYLESITKSPLQLVFSFTTCLHFTWGEIETSNAVPDDRTTHQVPEVQNGTSALNLIQILGADVWK